jgi:hypothetical protein
MSRAEPPDGEEAPFVETVDASGENGSSQE